MINIVDNSPNENENENENENTCPRVLRIMKCSSLSNLLISEYWFSEFSNVELFIKGLCIANNID